MSKRVWIITVTVIVVAFLLAYMMTYQVRYDQVAVLTTFDRADEPQYKPDGQIDEDHPGSLKLKPGLYFKAPRPFQHEYIQPKRLQILEDQLQEMQTADGFSVIPRVYLMWRIQNPYAFFKSLGDEERAAKELRNRLTVVASVIGRCRFDELVNTDPSQIKLEKIEEDAFKELRAMLNPAGPTGGEAPGATTPPASGQRTNYGIEVVHLGIRRLVLPESVTGKVFARMQATRERMAADARSTGQAQANAIRSQANAAQKTILAFAEGRAEAIRGEGDAQAAEFLPRFKADEGFAAFLRQIDALKKMLANQTIFVLDANTISPLDLFTKEPSAVAEKPEKK